MKILSALFLSAFLPTTNRLEIQVPIKNPTLLVQRNTRATAALRLPEAAVQAIRAAA